MIPVIKPELSLTELLKCAKGAPVNKFENEFANLVGAKYAVSFPYGRTALYSLLSVLGIQKSEILMPAYTCLVVADAVVQSGNIPRFADISTKGFNADAENLECSYSSKTRAVIPTHMYGYPVDVRDLKSSVKDRTLIVEDACLGILSSLGRRRVGCLADAGFFSFNTSKQMTTIGGGMAVTNDETVYQRLVQFHDQNMRSDVLNVTRKVLSYIGNLSLYKRLVYTILNKASDASAFVRMHSTRESWSTEKIQLPNDFLTSFTRFQAAVGLAQLKRVGDFTEKRIKLVKLYDELLHTKRVEKPPIMDGASYSHYTIRCDRRDALRSYLRKNGVNTGLAFDYTVPATKSYASYARGHYANSAKASQTVLNLPLYPSLPAESVELVCNLINRFG